MSSLEERLKTIRDGAVERIAAEHRERMHQATEALKASGDVSKAVKEGDQAPGFTLADSRGRAVTLRDLLDQGPLVLTFFRGHW